jgi:4-hydroxythreonine-4-phosphate dehydrogenase
LTFLLAVSTGDPAGVGPAVSVAAALREASPTGPAVALVGDAGALERLARARGGAVRRVSLETVSGLSPGEIGVVHACEWDAAVEKAHAPTAEGGTAQLLALETAARLVLDGTAHALVTAPISKRAVELSGVPFRGHTEHLARMAGLADADVSMLFLGLRLRVGLVTTHVRVRDAGGELSTVAVERTIRHLSQAIARVDAGTEPLRIAVTGLNPHAGEGGKFGPEDDGVIAPGIEAARRALAAVASPARRAEILGPIPAETAFRWAREGQVHGVVAMLHDQATIASKLLDWGDAVNVTWGLPFVRTSVDHGVAYDAARAGTADASGMIAALRLATRLAPGPTRSGERRGAGERGRTGP